MFLERPDVPLHLDHAIRLFQSAIGKDARFALAYAGLGQAYWAQYRETQQAEWTSKATAAILDALRIDPDQPEVRISLAIMYQGIGRPDAAQDELRKVIAAQPRNDDAHRLLAGIYIDHGQWDDAVAELHQAIELRPNYWRNHSELGTRTIGPAAWTTPSRRTSGSWSCSPTARADFTCWVRCIRVRAVPRRRSTTMGRPMRSIPPPARTPISARSISGPATTPERADAYQRAIVLAPNQPDLHANLGDALSKLGQRTRARASYRTAVEKVREQLNVNANDALNLSLLALYMAKLEDRPGADAAVQKALALNPQDAEVLYAAAVVDALAGRVEESCKKLGDALGRGASVEIVRQADELRVLKGCPAYDRSGPR